MPNWCANIIKISGTKSNLDVLKSKLTEQKDESINFMEYLIGLGDIPDDDYEEDQRHYNLDRFGTKWDFPFSELQLTIEEDLISIVVDSAWSPIIPFLSTLCQVYNVTAEIKYFEPNDDFGGIAEIDSDGNEYDYRCSYKETQYHYFNEAFWEDIESDIEEKLSEVLEELKEQFEFLSEEDIEKIKKMLNL